MSCFLFFSGLCLYIYNALAGLFFLAFFFLAQDLATKIETSQEDISTFFHVELQTDSSLNCDCLKFEKLKV